MSKPKKTIIASFLAIMLLASPLNAQDASAQFYTVPELFFIGTALAGLTGWIFRNGAQVGDLKRRVDQLEKQGTTHQQEIDDIKKNYEMLVRIEERQASTQRDLQEIKQFLFKKGE